MNVAPGATFEAATDAFAHSATIGVRIRDGQGADFLARTVSGVTEDVTVGTAAVFRRTFTAPTVAGQYLIVWDNGANVVDSEELMVSASAPSAGTPSGSDLCTLADVKAYVPAYDGNTADDVLQALITAESDLFSRDARREIARHPGGAATRLFTVNRIADKARIVQIGDLSTADAITVSLLKDDGTADDSVEDLYVPLYDGDRNPIAAWQPVTELAFPRHLEDTPRFCTGKVLSVNGVWGFPSIPSFVAQGVAARVIVRYLIDVAAQGTDFSDAIVQSSLNFGGLNDRAEDALQAVQRRPWP